MNEMIENKPLTLQKELRTNGAAQSREKIATARIIGIYPGIIACCFQFNHWVFYQH